MRNRVENDQPVIVPVATYPTLPQNGPMPQPRPDAMSGAPMAPAAPVAPVSAPGMPSMPKPAAPAPAPDLRMMSPSELAASARSMYKEPGNAFSAIGQGMLNARALRDQQQREIALADREEAKKQAELAKQQAEQARQIEYLDRMSPELADAARNGFMTPQEAYTAFRTDKAKGVNRKLETFPDGTVAWVYPDTGDVEPVGNYAKPQDANSAIGKLAQDFENGLINEEQYKQGLADMAPKGMTIESDGSGGFRMVQGVGVGSEVADAKASNQATSTSVITTAAQRAREAAKARDFGEFGQGIVSKIPWTDAAEVARQVEVLTANAKIENLNAMRAASKTGGALGSVTEKEAVMLADKTGALDPSSPTFLRDLDDYELTLLRTVHGYEAGTQIFEQSKGVSPAAGQPSAEVSPDLSGMSDEELEALANGG